MTDLTPAVPVADLYPPNTAFMARTGLHETRFLGYTTVNLETLTTLLSGLMTGRPTVRHAAGTTPEILATYARAGLRVEEELHSYTDEKQAFTIGQDLVRQGFRLINAYPMPADIFPDSALLVPNALYNHLNAKENLPQIVPGQNLMARRIVPLTQALDLPFTGPVWLKLAGAPATGWGFAVRHCPDAASYRAAVRDLASLPGATDVIIESDAQIQHCWCACLVVGERSVTYGGFAEQMFANPGKQSGSIIDPDHPFPAAGIQLVESIGRAAQALAFRGIAGLDIGQRPDGELVVFDPNFRFNSSTAQALFHQSAAARAGLPASLSFHCPVPGLMTDILNRLFPAIDQGWFIPTRLLDASLLPLAEGQNYITGFVLGKDKPHALQAAETLRGILLN